MQKYTMKNILEVIKYYYSQVTQLEECRTVNSEVVGSYPTLGAFFMNKDVYEVGTMLYHPYQKKVGWIIEVFTITVGDVKRISYIVEWADGERYSSFYPGDWYKAFHQLANE